MAFRLTKWYGDGVSAEGVCRIGYWAELQWGGFTVKYAAVMEGDGGTRTTVRAGAGPRKEGGGYRWEEPGLGVDWRWEAAAPGYRAELMEGVRWDCVMPAARAEVGFAGDGYLERLELTVAPWRLPMETLRWGRYVGSGDSVVWVEWEGAVAGKVMLRRGEAVEALGDELVLREEKTLRCGALGESVLGAVPGLAARLPVRMLRAEETKWLSRGAVRRDGAVVSEGWAVHEVVRWPG